MERMNNSVLKLSFPKSFISLLQKYPSRRVDPTGCTEKVSDKNLVRCIRAPVNRGDGMEEAERPPPLNM